MSVLLGLGLAATVAAPASATAEREVWLLAWEMPSWIDSTTPSWPQNFHTYRVTNDLNGLDAELNAICGTQFQLDLNYAGEKVDNLIETGVLYGPNNPPEDLIPGGWGTAYKLIQTPPCPLEDASASASTTPATCTAAGTVTFSITNATWDDETDLTDGSRTATALAGHVFADTLAPTATVTYVLEPLNPALCPKPDPEVPVLAETGSIPEPLLGGAGLLTLLLGVIAVVAAKRHERMINQ